MRVHAAPTGANALKRVAIGVLIGLGLLMITEGVLRLIVHETGHASIPDKVVAEHVSRSGMKYDADFGWTWADVPVAVLGINSDGFRYAELTKDKPAGTLRGFTLGDSQTFGAGLDADKSYTAVAEQTLKAQGWPVQFINAATVGYGSLQVLRLLEFKVMQWHPDFIVIDCRTRDSARETRVLHQTDALTPVREFLFSSRIYYVLRLALPGAGGDKGRRLHAATTEEIHGGEGNHDVIVEFAKNEGLPVVFLDYPFWDPATGIGPRAPASELPPGVTVVPATAALLASGLPPSALFFENNHLAVRGADIVGHTLADTLIREVLPGVAAASGIAAPAPSKP